MSQSDAPRSMRPHALSLAVLRRADPARRAFGFLGGRSLHLACVALLAALLLTGCAAAQKKSPSERLHDAAVGYYDGLRWKVYRQAAAFLPAGEQADFIRRKEAERDAVSVLEYELRRLELGPDGEQAVVEVEYTWHKMPSTTLRTTRVQQRWQRVEDAWLMMEQTEVKKDAPAKDDAPPRHPLL